jgi:predicted nucleic acid-binding protein
VRYLVDANVLSEPTKRLPDAKVVEWLRHNERELAVDPIILGELRFGILLLRNGRRRSSLERWFDAGVQRLRCLPWEAETGLRWAQLLATLRAAGRAMPIKDSLIAATALVHGLTVVTRNRVDFEKAGLAIIDPFGRSVPTVSCSRCRRLAPPLPFSSVICRSRLRHAPPVGCALHAPHSGALSQIVAKSWLA